MRLKKALPPIVIEATIVVITMLNQKAYGLEEKSLISIAAEHVPLIIPHISPTTSPQTLDTFAAFLTSMTAFFAPATFLAAIDNNGAGSQEVDATAIASKAIAIIISRHKSKIEITTLDFDAVISVIKLMQKAVTSVTSVIFSAQTVPLEILFLGFGSGFMSCSIY